MDRSASRSTVAALPSARRAKDRLLVRLGHRVRSLRVDAGYTQESLAAECDLHPTYVSSIERGERNVSLRNLVVIARAVGVTVSKLLDGVDR